MVFALASLGNCATYLMQKRTDSNASWSFDVGYVNVAAFAIYGYAVVVPLAFYFLLQYLGTTASLIRFWCMWGYSLFIFILSSVSLCLTALCHLFLFFLKNLSSHSYCMDIFSFCWLFQLRYSAGSLY